MGIPFRVWEHEVPEGVSLEPLDRFVGRTGVTITHTDVSTIDIRLFRIPDRVAIFSVTGISPGLGVLGPIFDTLQTDGRWAPDNDIGYNFRYLITQAALLAQSATLLSGARYRVEIIVHTTTWEDLVSVHEYTILSTHSIPT